MMSPAAVRGAARAVIVVALVAGCASRSAENEPTSIAPSSSGGGSAAVADAPAPPPAGGVLDYQLGGPYDAVRIDGHRHAIDVVVRDATAAPLAGAYSICYVNGFQTQPDASAAWLAEHPDLILTDGHGSPVTDPDWPDEYVLDPAAPAQRDAISALIIPVIEGCADSGYQAVEIDNLDTFERFPDVTADAALDLARRYVDAAHAKGLAIGQKNAPGVARRAREEAGFDFAIAEECAAYGECAAYMSVYGDHVLEIEYPDALAEAGLGFADVCASRGRVPTVVLRDRELVAEGTDGYVYEAC